VNITRRIWAIQTICFGKTQFPFNAKRPQRCWADARVVFAAAHRGLQRLETYAAHRHLFRIASANELESGGAVMVKPTKYLRKQAAKAEVAALRINDPEISSEMLAMASAYRNQADVLKKHKKTDRKNRPKVSGAR
jgi:hypothetical protein